MVSSRDQPIYCAQNGTRFSTSGTPHVNFSGELSTTAKKIGEPSNNRLYYDKRVIEVLPGDMYAASTLSLGKLPGVSHLVFALRCFRANSSNFDKLPSMEASSRGLNEFNHS